jgi:hypothetical protein
MRNLHRKCLSELTRLMPREHQSSQFRGHFPHSDTPSPPQSVGGSRLSLLHLQISATHNWRPKCGPGPQLMSHPSGASNQPCLIERRTGSVQRLPVRLPPSRTWRSGRRARLSRRSQRRVTRRCHGERRYPAALPSGTDRVCDLRQCLDCGGRAFQLAAAMVGDDDAVGTGVG